MTMRLSTRSSARAVRGALAGLVLAALAACGGKQTAEPAVPAGGTSAGGASGAQAGGQSGEMVPPETMDEINRSLDRKRNIVSRCLAIAVDNKELPRNSAGKITLEIVIAPGGKAESVKVVRATLESKTLADCVIHHVQEIQFPELPKPYETSYTYGFEAM
jgi:hypothetical protein